MRNNFKLKLADVIEEIYRYPTFYGIEYKTEGIPVIKGENISKDGLIDEVQDFDYIDEETNSKFHKTQLLKGDLIFTVRGLIGKVGYFTKERGNINANVIKIRIKEDYNSYFYWLYLNSSIGQKLIQNVTSGQVQATITVDDILNIPIPDFDDDKEDEIIKLLESAYQSKVLKLHQAQESIEDIDTFIYNSLDLKEPEQKENSINNRVFKVHLSPAFTDRLDPHFYNPEFEENDDLIRTLNHKKLKDIISFSNESWNQKDYFTETFPYIEISEINLLTGEINNVVETPIDNAASRAKMIVRENDIIVSTTRPHRGAITKITKENDFSIASTGFAVLRDIKIKDLDRDYLLYILRSELVKKQLLQRSSGGNYPAITQGELKKVIIPIPDIQIQKSIIAEVEKRISTHKRLLQEAETEFQQAKQQVEQIILGK